MTVRAARMSPPGVSGIATVAVVGHGSWEVIRPLFRTAKGNPTQVQPPAAGSLRFGHFGEPPGDEVVLASGVASAPREGPAPRFEIHCHGGRQVVDWVLDQLE